MKIPFLRIGKPWNKNAAILCSVPDTHGYVYSQKTGYVYSQKTAYVYSQKTGYVYSQTTGYVYSQKTGYVYSQKFLFQGFPIRKKGIFINLFILRLPYRITPLISNAINNRTLTLTLL
jgi:hypothetical protein